MIFINCFARDPNRNINVSRVQIRAITSEAGPTICVVSGVRDGNRTFGPLVIKSEFSGLADLFVDVPDNNDTQVVSLNCHLAAPSAIGPSRLVHYIVTTR